MWGIWKTNWNAVALERGKGKKGQDGGRTRRPLLYNLGVKQEAARRNGNGVRNKDVYRLIAPLTPQGLNGDHPQLLKPSHLSLDGDK